MCRLFRYALLAALLLSIGWSRQERRLTLGDRADIVATPVVFDPTNPTNSKAGALTFLGGVKLTSSDLGFGGFSSLIVDRGDFTLLSDGGTIVRFRMDPSWQITAAAFGDLPAGPGDGWPKNSRDSESMTRDPASGHVWVGFESKNEIWRYSHGLGAPAKGVAPTVMHGWSRNGGPESMARLRDGHFLVIAETDRRENSGGARNAIMFAGDPVEQPDRGFRFGYMPPEGFDPSDAAELPDGRILVLNRRIELPFDWSAILTVIDRKSIRPGAIVRGREIARLAAPLNVDNFEGVAITKENAATILWIVSDDNLFFMQRTLLIKFRLDVPPEERPMPPRRRPASS